MSWTDPRTWFSSTPATPEPVSQLPPPTPAYGARRRKTYRGRKGSKRYHSNRARTGRKSSRV